MTIRFARPVAAGLLALTMSSGAGAVVVPFALDLSTSPLVLAVPQFDGPLSAVEYRVFGDAAISATIRVTGALDGDSAEITQFVEYRVSGPNVAFVIPENLNVFPSCDVTGGSECEGTYPFSTVAETDPGAPIVLTGADVDAYEGAGTVAVTLSIFTATALPGGADFFCPDAATCEVIAVEAAWEGSLELIYTPGPLTAVPAPAAVGMFAAGLLGLAATRRRAA